MQGLFLVGHFSLCQKFASFMYKYVAGTMRIGGNTLSIERISWVSVMLQISEFIDSLQMDVHIEWTFGPVA